jgi:RPA family protein
MTNEDDPQIEASPLCTSVTREGITVRVYRIAESGEGWSLEVVDPDGGSIVWSDLFATDRDAYAEFTQTLEAEGIRSFAGSPQGLPH